ncbi:MAG: hypothetical protein HC817_09705 [Saprospiraceae bacterium]|nr:hypothetical protein [Saprospiraceae bacterium]
MYLVPLNLDYFFKKVFSDKHIAARFLEDLLSVSITAIEYLDLENKITNESVVVKFDFRCKIDGRYVIIEMQQTYKTDVIKRFYMYHSVSTALQLESLKPLTVTKNDGKKYLEKNYSTLEPVLTLVWMVDDVLGFEEDIVAFTMLPEDAKDFITDENLWKKPLNDILEERKKVLKILKNETKGLDFLTENKVIYIFQKNIVRNRRVNLAYYKWFDFASKSRNKNNEESDFEEYKKDKDMAEMIKRLKKKDLTKQEADFATSFLRFEIAMEQMRQEKDADRKELQKINEERLRERKERMKERKERMKAEQEKTKAEQEKTKAEQEKQLLQIKVLKMMMNQEVSLSVLAETLGITAEETTELIKKLQNMN